MGWGQGFVGGRAARGRNDRRLAAAASVAAVQLALVLLFEIVRPATGDNYGVGYGGALAGLFLCCLGLVAPAGFALAGLLHAVTLTLPAVQLARFASRFVPQSRKPTARRTAAPATLLTLGLLWAVLLAHLLGLPYLATAAWTVGSGVLPMAAVAYCARRDLTPGRIWGRSTLTGVLLSGAVLGGTLVATHAGLLKEYEPPRLTAAQLTGVWEGEDDESAVLRLDADGRATLTALPYEDVTASSIYGDLALCDSAATWTLGTDTASERDAVELDPTGESCPGETGLTWTIGGTETEPELFALYGDPDAGDVVILVRRPS
ncbi:hypothetical protein ACFVT5_11385 [Streptomyces sp. NPDC058001]|uniref:hypothetical protein n=1 Tax=Streptomyces sp. NPDC058001 TaxID=3346300 RepID=UPI0036E34A88